MTFLIKNGCSLDFIQFNKDFSIGKFVPNGSFYIHIKDTCYIVRQILFGRTKNIQNFLYKKHIYWHNWFTDECCQGFECCRDKCTEEEKQLLKDLVRANMEEIPYVIKENKNRSK